MSLCSLKIINFLKIYSFTLQPFHEKTAQNANPRPPKTLFLGHLNSIT